jgi:hypothetical protein
VWWKLSSSGKEAELIDVVIVSYSQDGKHCLVELLMSVASKSSSLPNLRSQASEQASPSPLLTINQKKYFHECKKSTKMFLKSSKTIELK